MYARYVSSLQGSVAVRAPRASASLSFLQGSILSRQNAPEDLLFSLPPHARNIPTLALLHTKISAVRDTQRS